ncbi:unnamed protein product [Rodentolepis nana]|uniref:FGGY_C domain-containing protein n=1 Tax=Rodentolepis nana TaxID=102285 RepID=A0A0R3TY50_RODNA|nr:unnamed protein product [Rodentolepis nana]
MWVYEKLSHAASHRFDANGSPLSRMQSPSEIIVDPRLFLERYEQASPTEASGGSVTNIHPDDMFSLPSVYSAICSGVVRNLVSMAPPELLDWANVKELYCMGGALKRNPLLLEQLMTEYPSVDMNSISEDKVIEACVGAALYTATVIEASKSS